MSSPLATAGKSRARKGLVGLHQRFVHRDRVSLLTERIAAVLVARCEGLERIRCLDIGCGDSRISEGVQRLAPRTSWYRLDLYDLPASLSAQGSWKNYVRFDGKRIPFASDTMDVSLLCDVLHHAGEQRLELLCEAARVSRLVIVKDHFEYSAYSRLMLRLMDFVGNWGYGVSSPGKYFSRRSFTDLCGRAGLRESQVMSGIDLYAHHPLLRHVLRPQWQFIAVLSSERSVPRPPREAAARPSSG